MSRKRHVSRNSVIMARRESYVVMSRKRHVSRNENAKRCMILSMVSCLARGM